MTNTLKQFKARAFARRNVKKAYDELAEEFDFLDEVLKARALGSNLEVQLVKDERRPTTRSRQRKVPASSRHSTRMR
jgi:hypothetical protein